MISFKAKYIQPTTIKHKGIDSQFHDYKAAIAELKTCSQNDLMTINELNCDWSNCQTLANDIAKIYNSLYANTKPSEDESFFVVTTQKDKFDKLDREKILGIIQTKKTNNVLEIENLQVSPETNYAAVVRQFKQVGRRLVEFIINSNNNNRIELLSERSAIPFYEKLGFTRISGNLTRMVLKK